MFNTHSLTLSTLANRSRHITRTCTCRHTHKDRLLHFIITSARGVDEAFNLKWKGAAATARMWRKWGAKREWKIYGKMGNINLARAKKKQCLQQQQLIYLLILLGFTWCSRWYWNFDIGVCKQQTESMFFATYTNTPPNIAIYLHTHSLTHLLSFFDS